jgi:Ca2+-binding RTX toxin-like protein
MNLLACALRFVIVILAGALTSEARDMLYSLAPTVVIDTAVSAAELNSQIANAAAGTTFILTIGVHEFEAPIIITRSDITLRGESETGTQLRFSLPVGQEATNIQITGGTKTYVSTATNNITAGSNTITVANVGSLQAGDSIYIYQPNTAEYLSANGWTNVTMTDAANRPFREFIAEIDRIEGDQVILKSPVPFAMDATETRVFEIDMVKNVALSDFTVTNDLPPANPYNFINALPAYDSKSAIQFTGTLNASLSHVSVLNAASNGVTVQSSTGFTGNDILVDGALNKGGEGNGYGILVSESFNNTFTGLDLYNGRHSFILSAWNAETGNTVQINNTNRDINFHGSPDRGNTITVDHAVLQYDPSQNTSGVNSIWALVSHGGRSQPYTDIYATNDVQFHFAVGASAADTIFGTADGDYLNGAGGADKINGGAGNDYIVGGLKRDIMTGGAGSDTFLLKMGDDLDRIKDFTFGATGDTLIFAGNAAVTSMANLKFTQTGADLTIKYGVNSTVILENHTIADVSAANLVFDPSGAQTAAAWNGDYVL